MGGGGTIQAYTAATVASSAAAVNDTTGTANYDLTASGTLGTNASFNTLRYTGNSGFVAGAFTANGLLNASSDGGPLTVGGNVTIGATRELVVTAARNVTLSGTVSDGFAASTLIKSGSGVLTLSASNAHAGGTIVNAGTLLVNHPSALGATTAALTVGSGTVDLGYYSPTVGSLSGGPGGVIGGVGTLTVASTTPSTFSGRLSVNVNLVKAGASTLTLSGSNVASSITVLSGRLVAGSAAGFGNGATPLIVNGGTLDTGTFNPVVGALSGTSSAAIVTTADVPGTRTLTVNTSGNSAYAGAIQDNGPGVVALVKSGIGVLELSGLSSFTGTTRIVAGTLVLSATNSGWVANGLAGSTLDMNAADSGSLAMTAPLVNIGGLTGSRSFTVPSSNLGYPYYSPVTVAVGGNGQSTTYSGALLGSGTFIKQGGGTLTLAYSGTPTSSQFAGVVRIANGSLALGGQTALANATIDMNAADAGALTFSGTAPQSYSIRSLSGSRGIDLGGNTLSISGGSSGFGGVYAGTLSGSGNLIFSGSGYSSNYLELSGSSSFTGTTRIVAGTLVLSATNSGWVANGLAGSTLDMNAADSGSLAMTAPLVNIGGLTGSRSFTVPSNSGSPYYYSPVTVAVGGNGQNTTYSGALLGSGTFIKQGGGTLTLTYSGTPTSSQFAGVVRIANGSLALGGQTALANALVDMNAADAGSLTFSGTVPQTYSISSLYGSRGIDLGVNALSISSGSYAGTLSGPGNLIVNGTGYYSYSNTLVLSGSSSFTGTTRIVAGTLVLSATNSGWVANGLAGSTLDMNAADSGSLAMTAPLVNIGGLTGSRSFTVPSNSGSPYYYSPVTVAVGGNGQNTTYSGALLGSGTFMKQGAGTLTLTGTNNQFSGAVVVNAGTLNVTRSLAANIAVNSTGVLGGSGTVGSVTVNSGGTIMAGTGPGTLTTGSVVFNGGGNYNWQVTSGSGSAGSDWDFINSAGALTVNATAANPFRINLWTLSGTSPEVNGPAANFDRLSNYTWKIGSFAGGINGFSPNLFSLVTGSANGTGGFANPFVGAFSITTSGKDLNLVYSVPQYSSYTYTAGTGLFSNGANWSVGVPPVGTPLVAISGPGGTATNDQLAAMRGLVFAGSAGSYVVTGSGFSLGAEGVVNNSTSSQTVQSPLVLTSSGTFAANAGPLSFTGSINPGGFTVAVAGTYSTSISAIIGSGGLIKTGSFTTLSLTGSNSFTGTTRIAAGTLRLETENALAGSTVDLALADTGTLTSWISTVNLGGLSGGRSFMLPASTVTVGGNGQNTTYSGPLLGGGTFIKQGVGTLTLTYSGTSSASQFNGTVRIANGSLALGGSNALVNATIDMNSSDSGALTFSGTAPQTYSIGGLTGSRSIALGGNTLAIGGTTSASYTYSGAISGLGGVVKTGSFVTMTLSGSNSFTGTTRIAAGRLRLTNSDALAGSTLDLAVTDTGTLSVLASNLNLGGLTGGRSFTLPASTVTIGGNGQDTEYGGALLGGGTLIKQGVGILTLTYSGTSSASQFNGTVRIANGALVLGGSNALVNATIDMNSSDSGALTFSGTAPQTYSIGGLTGWRPIALGANTLAIGGTTSVYYQYSGVLSGSGGLIKTGSFTTLSLSGSNSFTGTTRIAAGTLELASSNALAGSTLDVAIADTGTLSTYYYSYLSTVNLGGLSGGRSFTLPAGTVTVGGNGQDTTYSGALLGGGTLIKQGVGILTLTYSGTPSASQFNGTVRIANGALAIGGSNALVNATIDMNSSDSGALTFSGTAPQTYSIGGLTGWRSIALGGNTLAIGGTTSAWYQYTGSLSGSGGLIKTGSFTTLTLSGSNSFTGNTRISAGTLQLTTSNALAGSTLDLSIADTGTLSTSSISTVNLGGLSGGRSFTLPASTVTIGGNGQDTEYGGALLGGGTLIKQGTGALTLAYSGTPSSSQFAGTLRIANGSVALGGQTALVNATVDMNSADAGALTFSGTASQTYSIGGLTGSRSIALGGNTLAIGGTTSAWYQYTGSLSGSGGLIKTGSFTTLTLSGSNSFTGNTRISAGTLQLTTSNALAGSTLDLSIADTGTLSTSSISTVNLGGLSGGRSFTLPASTVAVGGNGQDTTYSGALLGGGTFIKQGPGTLTLTGTAAGAAFSGLVRIASGSLALGSPFALYNATIDMSGADSGALVLAGNTPQTYYLGSLTGSRPISLGGHTLALNGGDYGGSLSGSGGLVSYSRLTLFGSNAFTGLTRIASGTLGLGNANALAGSTLDMNGADGGAIVAHWPISSGTVTLGGLAGSRPFSMLANTVAVGPNGQDTTFGGPLLGSGLGGLFIKQGGGTLTLSYSGTPSPLQFGGTVRIAGGSLALAGPSALANATIDMNASDAGVLAFSGSSGQTYSIGGLIGSRNIALGGNTLAIGGTSGGYFAYSGVLSGSGGLIKTGSFTTLALAAPNSFTGTTRITAGTLELWDPNALAASTLDLAVADTGSVAFNSMTTNLGGLAGGRSLMIPGSSLSSFNVGANGQDTTYSGQLLGSGTSTTFIKQGRGALTLSYSGTPSATQFAGTVRIASGSVTLSGQTALANATIDMNAADAGVFGLSSTGSQTYVVGGLTGSRAISLGGNSISVATGSYAGTLSGSGGLVKTGSFTTLTLSGSNSFTGNTRIASGTLQIVDANALANSTLELATADSGVLAISTEIVNLGGLAGSRSLTFPNPYGQVKVGSNGASTTFSGPLRGTGLLIKQGLGTLTLSYSGTPSMSQFAGTVRVGSGTLVLDGPTALSNARLDMNNLDSGSLVFTGTTPQTFFLRALQGSRAIALGGNTLSIGGTITPSTSLYSGSLSGSGGLIKTGPGTLRLSGSNSFTGVTQLSSGVLEIANANAVANSTLDLTASGSSTVTIATGSANLGGLSGSGPLNIPSVIVAVGGNGQSTTFSGALLGSGTFIKQGSGTLSLTGTSSFTGATVVNGGRLVGTASSLAGVITNNAFVEFAQTTDGTFAGRLTTTSTGSVIPTAKSGAGTLTLTGTVDGGLTVSSGRLVTQAANLGAGRLVADGTVEIVQSIDGTLVGGLSGVGELVKSGTGTLTIPAGSFLGSTTIAGGRLVASASTIRGPVANNGTLEFAQGTLGEFASVVSGSGIVVKSGAGTLMLSGSTAATGKVVINEGILATAAADRLADAADVFIASGATLRLGGSETIAALIGSGSVNLQSSQLTIAGGRSSTYGGTIFGVGGLTKAGVGVLALGGSNSFLGATNLTAGTLVLSNSTALSPFTTLSIAAGSTLQLDANVRVFAYTNAGGVITGTGQLLTSATATTSGTLTSLTNVSGSSGYAVGLLKTSTGTLVVSGSTSFTGGVVVQEGTVKLASGGGFASSNVVDVRDGATLDLNGQSQTVAALAGSGSVALGGATLTVDAAASTTFAGTIEGGSLVKSGDSVLALTGSTSVTTAAVNSGVLSVNGTLAGDVEVAPGGTLGGAGLIIGDVTVGGVHAPGNSPEISTISGNVSYLSGASVIWEIAANTDVQGPPGARVFDQILVGSDLTFAGTTTLALSFLDNDPNSSWASTVDWNDAFWDRNRSWTLWDVAGTTTDFASLVLQNDAWLDSTGLALDAARPGSGFALALDGNDVTLVYTVPEPGSLVLVGLGAACLWVKASRRSTKAVGGAIRTTA